MHRVIAEFPSVVAPPVVIIHDMHQLFRHARHACATPCRPCDTDAPTGQVIDGMLREQPQTGMVKHAMLKDQSSDVHSQSEH